MIPSTLHNMDPFVCLSSMQKCIRRGMEREAMEAAVELLHTSKAFCTMVCNRLEIISHEDVGLADPSTVLFVATAVEQAKRNYDIKSPGKARIIIGNAIRLLARAPKSREGDHFQAACGLPNLREEKLPEIPEFAYDMHTCEGKERGRGLQHFREESAKLMPEPAEKDAYEEEAFAMWAVAATAKNTMKNATKSSRATRHTAQNDPPLLF